MFGLFSNNSFLFNHLTHIVVKQAGALLIYQHDAKVIDILKQVFKRINLWFGGYFDEVFYRNG
ncbi:MAG: hypothetical protein ACD_34C00615G0003 [uncultured bacterium]|nr:MAG: hypothetical protein ACD_34C00615G0003 [uncultured bacterium]